MGLKKEIEKEQEDEDEEEEKPTTEALLPFGHGVEDIESGRTGDEESDYRDYNFDGDRHHGKRS